MGKFKLIAVAVTAFASAGLLPAVRNCASATWAEIWCEEDVSPERVSRALRDDLEKMVRVRQDLIVQGNSLIDEERKPKAFLEQANLVLNELRDAYQSGADPVTVRGVAYTREQLAQQVENVMTEIDSFEENLASIQELRSLVDDRLNELGGEINRTKSEIAILPAKAALIGANSATSHAAELAAKVDEALKVAPPEPVNPVRSVKQLIAAGDLTVPDAGRQRAERFLTGAGQHDIK